MLILLYGCTTSTLTKRMEKKLDSNYTRMVWAILNKSWRQYPTKRQLYGHLPLCVDTGCNLEDLERAGGEKRGREGRGREGERSERGREEREGEKRERGGERREENIVFKSCKFFSIFYPLIDKHKYICFSLHQLRFYRKVNFWNKTCLNIY